MDVLEGLCHVVSDWPMDAIDRSIQRIAEHCITMMSNLLGKDARSHEQALNLGNDCCSSNSNSNPPSEEQLAFKLAFNEGPSTLHQK